MISNEDSRNTEQRLKIKQIQEYAKGHLRSGFQSLTIKSPLFKIPAGIFLPRLQKGY